MSSIALTPEMMSSIAAAAEPMQRGVPFQPGNGIVEFKEILRTVSAKNKHVLQITSFSVVSHTLDSSIPGPAESPLTQLVPGTSVRIFRDVTDKPTYAEQDIKELAYALSGESFASLTAEAAKRGTSYGELFGQILGHLAQGKFAGTKVAFTARYVPLKTPKAGVTHHLRVNLSPAT